MAILDHFQTKICSNLRPLLFPNNSKSLKILDIWLRKVGAKRRWNGTSKVNRQTDTQTPCKETAGSGPPALDVEFELLESIIHHLGNRLQLCILEFHTLKNFHIKFVGYKNLFEFNNFVTIMTKSESLLFNVLYLTFSLSLSKLYASHFFLKSWSTI